MPKGVPIKNHLDEPDFKILYTTLKYSNLRETDFAQVAVEMGCKDATFARNLLNRTMKAQGKGNPTQKAAGGSKGSSKTSTNNVNGDGGGGGGGGGHVADKVADEEPQRKKRKKKTADVTESEARTEKVDDEDDKVKPLRGETGVIKQESGTEGEEDD